MFHPNDAPALLELLEVPTINLFGVYNGLQWTLTNVAQNVRNDETLLFRSKEVTRCVGQESLVTPTKRRATLTELADAPANIRTRPASPVSPSPSNTNLLQPYVFSP